MRIIVYIAAVIAVVISQFSQMVISKKTATVLKAVACTLSAASFIGAILLGEKILVFVADTFIVICNCIDWIFDKLNRPISIRRFKKR